MCAGHPRRRHRRRRRSTTASSPRSPRPRASTRRSRVAGSPGRGPDAPARPQIRTGPWGDRYGEVPDGLTLQSFRDAPHGIDCGPMVPRVREILETAERPDRPRAAVHPRRPRRASRARVERTVDGLVLTSRRHLRSNNSWMHNVKVLVKGKDRCTLLMHPDDAAPRVSHDGDARPRELRARARVEVAGRGQRRDDAGRGVAAPRLGPRQGRHPHGGRPRARGREQQPARTGRRLRPALEQRGRQRHPRRSRPASLRLANSDARTSTPCARADSDAASLRLSTAGAGEARQFGTDGCAWPAGPAPNASSTFCVALTIVGLYGDSGNSGGLELAHPVVGARSANTPAPLGPV